jgi:hypothetical protein
MTPGGFAVVAVTVVLAVLVGAYLAVAIQGGDTSALGAAAAAAGAFLTGLVTAELIRSRRDGR